MKRQYENVYMKRFSYFNVYVIKGKNGDILIDTGFIGMKKSLKKWLDQFNIKLIILTHAHVDHIWNVSYLKKLYNCKVAMAAPDIINLDNYLIRSNPSKKRYGLWTKMMNLGMQIFKQKAFKVDRILRDNQVINKYGINLKIISLKGHTHGSIGVLYNNYLFAGDALVNRKKYPEIAYQNQDNEEANNSYQRILEINPDMIFVGHDREFSITKLKEYKNV